MTETLRDRIVRAVLDVRLNLGPNAIDLARRGESIRLSGGEADMLVDAVMKIIEPEFKQRASDAKHYYGSGTCRHCGARPAKWWSVGNQRPHRMHCPLYTGPLEHRVRSVQPMVCGHTNACTCGRSWRDEDGACPDAHLDWRGPRGECEHCEMEERKHAAAGHEPGTYTRLVAATGFGHDTTAHRLYKGLLLMGVKTAEQVAALSDDEVYDTRNSSRQALERVRSRYPGPGVESGGAQ